MELVSQTSEVLRYEYGEPVWGWVTVLHVANSLIDPNTTQLRPVLSVANRLVYGRTVRENDTMKRHDCPQRRIGAIGFHTVVCTC